MTRDDEKEAIAALAAAMGVHPSQEWIKETNVHQKTGQRRNVEGHFGDPVIEGRIDRQAYVENTIHADGTGYSVMISVETRMQLTYALRALEDFCEVRQRGDTEAVLFMPKIPTAEQCETLRQYLSIRKIVEYTPEVLAAKRAAIAKINRKENGDRLQEEVRGIPEGAEDHGHGVQREDRPPEEPGDGLAERKVS